MGTRGFRARGGRSAEIRGLLARVKDTVVGQKNRVRHVMNAFVISVGTYVAPLTDEARAVGEAIGVVKVDMGGTACKVPLATAYIDKVVDKGRVGKKRKGTRC